MAATSRWGAQCLSTGHAAMPSGTLRVAAGHAAVPCGALTGQAVVAGGLAWWGMEVTMVTRTK